MADGSLRVERGNARMLVSTEGAHARRAAMRRCVLVSFGDPVEFPALRPGSRLGFDVTEGSQQREVIRDLQCAARD